MRLAFVVGVAASLYCGSAYPQAHQCSEAQTVGDSQVSAYYDPRIKQVSDAIADIIAKGGDPNSVAIKIGDKFYTLPEILAKLNRDKQIGLAGVAKLIDDCNQQVKPYQDVVNSFVNVETLGIASMLPGKMGFVDASDILAGYPLGGPDALVPKARDQLLNSLHIGGDVAKTIKDPVHAIKCIFGC
jgi:hypothetical protein